MILLIFVLIILGVPMKISYMCSVALVLALLSNGMSVCMFRKQVARLEKKVINVAINDFVLAKKHAPISPDVDSSDVDSVVAPQVHVNELFCSEADSSIRSKHLYSRMDSKDLYNLSATSKDMRGLVARENPELYSFDFRPYWRLSPSVYCYNSDRDCGAKAKFQSPAVGVRGYIEEHTNDPVVLLERTEGGRSWLYRFFFNR